MKRVAFFLTCLACATSAQSEDFYPVEFGVPSILSSSTSDDPDLGDLWAVSNLIQGPGVGFTTDEPHTGVANGSMAAWVTNDNAGFPADYIEDVSIPNGEFPRIVFDFGADAPLDEISVWAYSSTNSNGVSEFALRFATDAGGPDSFDTAAFPTLEFQPQNLFEEGTDMPLRQSFEFDELVTARYVEFTVLDNFYLGDGRGQGGIVDEFYEGFMELPGGDRVGLGEVAFRIPEDGPPAAGCDFDANGVCDIVDLDELLYTGLGTGDAKYDLNSDSTVDLLDRDAFLSELGTVAGDFDLDGNVNATDLNTLGGNWQQAVNSYANGDANGDGQANAADLNSVGSNWQFPNAAAPLAATVPEPTGYILAFGAMLGMLGLRRTK